MPNEAGGRRPLATGEQLTRALEALGVDTGGQVLPRAEATGHLLFLTEAMRMMDLDRLDMAQVHHGYTNMAVMVGMAAAGEDQLEAGHRIPGREFTSEALARAGELCARMLEHRMTSTLLEMEEATETQPGPEQDEFNIAWPINAWMRAVCSLLPHNTPAAEVDMEALHKAAQAAQAHAEEAGKHLADLLEMGEQDH